MPYKHIFFDLDHTLWDFEMNSKESLEDLYAEFALQEKGIPDFAAFHRTYAAHNDRMWERFRKGFINREELRWKRVWHTLLDFKIGDQQLVQDISSRYLEVLPTKKNLFPGTKDLLDYLAAKPYPIHLITNGFERTQHLKLRHSGIDHYFKYIVTSESAGSLKPHREIFDFALAKAGCRAAEAIMIGDALDIDVLGAQQAGIDQVYFNPAKPLQTTGKILPTYSIQTLAELKKIL